MKGYVYVLTNEAMPGLVKIGRSKHAAGVRAKALYKGDTGVPLPFDVHFECLFSDCVEAEALIHDYLGEHRINPNREFFRIDPEDAAIWVLRARAEYADHAVVEGDYIVCDAMMATVAYRFNLCPPEPYQLVDYISNDAWADAIKAYKKRFPERMKQAKDGLVYVDPLGNGDFELQPVDCDGCGHRTDTYGVMSEKKLCQECFFSVEKA